jgi:hypothetical protein
MWEPFWGSLLWDELFYRKLTSQKTVFLLTFMGELVCDKLW